MELVERERELDALSALLDGLARGQARTALIEGPAGIGKTRLLSEAKGTATARGVRVLSARGSELEREFPFGVVRQLFEPALAEAGERERLLEGAAAFAATVFDAPGSAGEGDGDSSFAALHALYWLTLNVAGEEPLLLAIDDIQWCDRPSLRLLAYLVRRLEGQALLVVATLRSAEPGTDTALLAEIAGDPLTDRIVPGPLSRAAVPALIERRLGAAPEAAFATACHEATGGNPLLLDELLKGLAAEGIEPRAERAPVVRDLGPRAVSRAVLLRLARLGDPDVAVARALAVLGEGAELGELAAMAELDGAAVARSTGELARVEIIRPEPPLGFVHPLVRDAVYNDLPPAQRQLDHARAARLLREAGAPPQRVAAHFLRVPPIGEEWAADLLVAAARSAADKGGAENAVAYLRRALEEPLASERRTAVLYELGQREMDIRGDEAVPHLRAAYEGLTDPEARAWAAFALSRTLMFIRREDESAQLMREVKSGLTDGFEDLWLALEALELQSIYFGRAEVEELERTEAYRGGPPGDGPGAKMLSAVTAYNWMHSGGSIEGCTDLARKALSGNTLFSIDNGLFWVTAVVVLVYADQGETEEFWEEARAAAHRRGSLFTMLTVDLWRGFDLLRRGDLEQARESIEDALEAMLLWAGAEGMAVEWPIGFLGELEVERGNLEAAEKLLGRVDPGETIGEGPTMWRKGKIRLLLARGLAEEALALCDVYEANLGTMSNPAAAPWRTLRAEVLDQLDRREEAERLATEELEAARAWGAAQAIGRALRVRGGIRREAGIEDLREAVATLEGSTARLELAKALLALGTALRLARAPTEARDPLRRAVEIGSACSADALVNRAGEELQAAGAGPRRTALGGVESLTPSERRVAGMAAEEMTNREIAQALFVTPKTVEVHLSNAYRKLEINSRRQLSAALT